MRTTKQRHQRKAATVCLGLTTLFCVTSAVLARDTDIYTASGKQNCIMLMDNSTSMNFPVYDHNIDYGAMYNYLYSLNSSPNNGSYTNASNCYIYDITLNSSSTPTAMSSNTNPLYNVPYRYDRNKIYLVSNEIGFNIIDVNGKDVAFTGDPADPDIVWDTSAIIDTHTYIEKGTLKPEVTQVARLQRDKDTDGNYTVLFENKQLPLNQDIDEHKNKALYSGAIFDLGFVGLLQAPGYYFSGYKSIGTTIGSNVIATPDNKKIYFFVTGNWLNMQAIFNLRYKAAANASCNGTKIPSGASQYGLVWPYESFPAELIYSDSWPEMAYLIDFPEDTPPSLTTPYSSGTSTAKEISVNAQKLKIHFSQFDITGGIDDLEIKSGSTTLAKFDNNSFTEPERNTGVWTNALNSHDATITINAKKRTGQIQNFAYGKGYIIDKIQYLPDDNYLIQPRMTIAKEAMTYVMTMFMDKINWSFGTFTTDGGGNVKQPLNPSFTDAQRQNFFNDIDKLTAEVAGTPLMGALQDIWIEGYHKKDTTLQKQIANIPCTKNYILSVTDGFPSVDNKTAKIREVLLKKEANPTAPDFATAAVAGDATYTTGHDAVTWTQDPSQYPTPIPSDYYDDVAGWMYHHSWRKDDAPIVQNPEESTDNVHTHHISFGSTQPMLEYAASKSGGAYIVANSKEQLEASFYAMALMMSQAISFTAPVVSVDAANKIQSGEDLYMGLFMPMSSTQWAGNVKKFKLGDGSSARPDRFMIYDARNQNAIDTEGQFRDDIAEFWDDYNSSTSVVNETDDNDHDSFGAADVKEDGAGQLLLKRVTGYLNQNSNYWGRPIYTTLNGTTLVPFNRDNIKATDLGVADNATRDKLINFTHGYTYDADVSGNPIAVRDWILGAIIHSRPVVIDYFDTTKTDLPLKKRFITVGSNDGMLHVFDDATGQEVLAFIPQDMLTKLASYQQTIGTVFDGVDGMVTLHRDQDKSSKTYKNPKYLIFGERRGGGSFWNLDISATDLDNIDPTKWKVQWVYTHPEIKESWSEVKIASLPYAVDSSTGARSYKNVAIFTAGYDPLEDGYPSSDGKTLYNSSGDSIGRGMFVVDLDSPASSTFAKVLDVSGGATTNVPILPFSATYGTPLTVATGGATQSLPEMLFSFPASPSVVTTTVNYEVSGTSTFKDNVLRSLYAVDIYANLFKTAYTLNVINKGEEAAPAWQISSAGWQPVTKIFASNPGSNSTKAGETGSSLTTSDQGRKAFYPPAISWGGSKGYFEASNYLSSEATFGNKDTMASLFFGTGDREHPNVTTIRNRFYALYDDSSITAATTSDSPVALKTPTFPRNETSLMNLSCDELGVDTTINSCYLGTLDGTCTSTNANTVMKQYLRSLLTDDVYTATSALEYQVAANNENDKKGWYIVLADQGSSKCSHVTYPTSVQATASNDHDNHVGEQVLSQAILYYGTLYFTTYQSTANDPCNQQGNGFAYALDYLDASAVYNLNPSSSDNKIDVTDRYKKFTGIYGIPSGFTVVIRDGHAAAMASMGGSIIGPGPDLNNPFEIATPGLGLELFYWRDSNSMQ